MMRAIGSREDVSHAELVLIRQRVIELYKRAVQQKMKLSPAQIAFVVLGRLENGATVETVLSTSVKAMLQRTQQIVKSDTVTDS